MPTCGKCGTYFKFHTKIDNKWRNLTGRRFCLDCSPFGKRNKRDLTKKPKSELNREEYLQDRPDKVCAKCKELLPVASFYTLKRGKNKSYRTTSYCKQCYSVITTKRNHDNKKLAVEYKGGVCIDCGYIGYLSVYEFHHLDPTQKDFEFSRCRSQKLNEKIKQELDKCVLLCANCHRTRHEKENHL